MKRNVKRYIAFALVVGIIITSFVYTKSYADGTDDYNRRLLDAILNERKWVADIIVDGNYTNPYITGVENFDDYSEAVYGRFMDDAANRTLVRLADILYNSGGYLKDALLTLMPDELLEIADLYDIYVPEDERNDVEKIAGYVWDFVDDLDQTRTEKYYDYIFNGIFSTSYKSYSQLPLEVQEHYLSENRTLIDNISNVGDVISNGKEWIGTVDKVNKILKLEYIDDYLPTYKESVSNFLNFDLDNIINKASEADVEIIEKNKKGFTESLYMMSALRNSDIEDPDYQKWRNQIQGDSFLKTSSKVLKVFNEAFSFTDSYMENCILLESIQQQRDMTLGPLDLLISNTKDTKLKIVARNYLDLMDDEFDQMTLLHKNGVSEILELAVDKLTDSTKKAFKNAAIKLLADNFSVGANKFVSQVASLNVSIGLTTFLTDKVTGVEETVKKVYQIEKALKIIDELKKIYTNALNKYNKDKTEENAREVLDILVFMKKARLFTCKLAYDSGANQLDSPLGRLLSNGQDKDNWLWQYEKQVDMLLSATINPVCTMPFELNQGDVLWIDISNNSATYKKKGYYDGTIGEIQQRLMGGIISNGGTINIINPSNKDKSFYLSNLVLSNDSKVTVVNGARLDVFSLCTKSGKSTFDLRGDMTVHKTFEADGSTYEFINDGKLNLKGDIFAKNITLPNMNINGDEPQTIEAENVTAKNLVFENTHNDGVTIKGTISVTKSVSNRSTTVHGGKKVVLRSGGAIVGNYYHSDLTVENYTADKSLTFGDSLYTNGTINFNYPLKITNGLIQNNGTINLNADSNIGSYQSLSSSTDYFNVNKSLNVKDIGLKNTELKVKDTLYLSGDYISSGSKAQIKDLNLVSGVPQTLSGNPIDVTNLYIDNSSSSGVAINININVSGNANNFRGKISGTGYTVISSSATISDNRYSGNIWLNGKSVDCETFYVGENLKTSGTLGVNVDLIDIDGDLILTGTETFTSSTIDIKKNLISSGNNTLTVDNLNIGNNLYQTSGAANISCAEINIEELRQTEGTMTFNDGTVLTIKNNCFQNGTVSGNADITINGEAKINTLSADSLEVKNDMINSGAVSLKTFTVSGKLHQKIGGGTISTEDLYLLNKSSGGISIVGTINVSGEYVNQTRRLNGNEAIIKGSIIEEVREVINGNLNVKNWVCEKNTLIKGNLISGGEITVSEGVTLEVEGDMKITGTLNCNSSTIIARNSLICSGTVNLTNTDFSVKIFENSGTVNISENSCVNIIGSEKIGGNIVNNGNLNMDGDVELSSANLSGVGTYSFTGDVYSKNSKVEYINVAFRSNTKQILNGSTFRFNNITVNNTSKDGLVITSSVKYKGALNQNGSAITFADTYLIKEEV